MTSLLRRKFTKSLFVLEGGYNLDSIEWASEGVLSGLLDPFSDD